VLTNKYGMAYKQTIANPMSVGLSVKQVHDSCPQRLLNIGMLPTLAKNIPTAIKMAFLIQADCLDNINTNSNIKNITLTLVLKSIDHELVKNIVTIANPAIPTRPATKLLNAVTLKARTTPLVPLMDRLASKAGILLVSPGTLNNIAPTDP
jgi:hypothetical protein